MKEELLLEKFVGTRDESAFEALMRLHGPMVLGVCTRVLGNHHDAEEAFQATFLVLSRKAASIMPRNHVGNWLYGVAYRTALKAQCLRERRRVREVQGLNPPEPEVQLQDQWKAIAPLLDRELNSLPEKYRVPVVLCDLEGKSCKEVASDLGCPEGTISSRLTRARSLLANRLRRQGVVLSVGTLAVMLTKNAASAAVPNALMMPVLQAAQLSVLQPSVASGAISGNVVEITDGVVKSMVYTTVKKIMIGLGLIACAGLGAIGMLQPVESESFVGSTSQTYSDVSWQVVSKDEAVALLNAAAAKSQENFERIKTWRGVFELQLEAYVNQDACVAIWGNKLPSTVKSGLIKQFLGDLTFAFDLAGDSRLYREWNVSSLNVLTVPALDQVTIPDLSPVSRRTYWTSEEFVEFCYKEEPSTLSYVASNPHARNKKNARRLPSHEGRGSPSSDLIGPTELYWMASPQSSWEELRMYAKAVQSPDSFGIQPGRELSVSRGNHDGTDLIRVTSPIGEDKCEIVLAGDDCFLPLRQSVTDMQSGKEASAKSWEWGRIDGIWVPRSFDIFNKPDDVLLWRTHLTARNQELNATLGPETFTLTGFGFGNGGSSGRRRCRKRLYCR
jgi:RNA polymerase sigma factor (sigma-70 family)